MSKVRRRMGAAFIACLLCCAMFATTAFAYSKPGPSTFGPGTQQFAGEMTFTNNNWIPVNPNEEKIQVYYDASTYNVTPPGPYRSLFVTYDFALV